MYPRTFLKTFWNMDIREQVFVAMSFDSKYQSRFENIFVPTITSLTVNGTQLQPYRVDISQSGDSILTQINDGIAHSRLVLADVSSCRSIWNGLFHKKNYRNANVMYEVGIALACRQPCEVLLVRDDKEDFLFDVSTIPHITLDFSSKPKAVEQLKQELNNRLQAQTLENDFRVKKTLATLSPEEAFLLKDPNVVPKTPWGIPISENVNSFSIALSRLIDKGIVVLAGEGFLEKGTFFFKFTPLGEVIYHEVQKGFERYVRNKPVSEPDTTKLTKNSI